MAFVPPVELNRHLESTQRSTDAVVDTSKFVFMLAKHVFFQFVSMYIACLSVYVLVQHKA